MQDFTKAFTSIHERRGILTDVIPNGIATDGNTAQTDQTVYAKTQRQGGTQLRKTGGAFICRQKILQFGGLQQATKAIDERVQQLLDVPTEPAFAERIPCFLFF